MAMYNPPHQGEFIKNIYLKSMEVIPRGVVLLLKVASSTSFILKPWHGSASI